MLRAALTSIIFSLNTVLCLLAQETVTTDAPVVVSDQTPDERIRERLEGIYRVVKEFQAIEVDVQSGVVTLSGEVPATRNKEEAIALVKRTDGVVLTVDRLEVAAEVSAQLSPALAKLRDIGKMLSVKLPLICLAILVLVFFWWLANFFYRRDVWFEKLRLSSLGRELLRRMIKLSLIVCGFLLGLEILDATAIVGAILGAAGLAGLAIGFAFKNIVENYLAGVLLSTRNPFEIGDVIEVEGDTGKVALLTSRDTVLVTLDGNHLRIPNSVIMNSKLLNYSRNPRRRFDFAVGVSCACDLNEARDIALETLKRNPGVLRDPKPVAVIDSLGDSSVILKFFAWLDQTQHDFSKVRSESIRLVKEAFEDACVEMPEPIYRINMQEAAADSEVCEPEIPSGKSHSEHESVSEEDLSTDHSIDEQIEYEQRDSKERNLLKEK